MKFRRLFFPAALLVVMGSVLGLSLLCEPHYRGHSLFSWLQQYEATSLMETQRRDEDEKAIRGIGAKRALPVLLRLVEARDDPVSLWIIDTGDRLRIGNTVGDRFIRWRASEDFQQLGIAGFEALGTNAGPAVDELARLLEEKDHTFTAQRCLLFIGKPAEPVFCRELTNQDWRIRQWSVDNLADVTDDVGVYIARIKPRLNDSSTEVRKTTVNDIGIQTDAPELAVPILLNALNDPSIRVNAINALAHFGTNALMALPALTNLVESDGETARAALKTLAVIAPDAAFPILMNCLSRGKPASEDALSALAGVRPAAALPIILSHLQSPDLKIRHHAFWLLRCYPATASVESAMETIAGGSDEDMTPSAKDYLTDLYVTNHPNEFVFPDEPSYGGKTLGEWLQTHMADTPELTPEAKQAIRYLGTNAIPALLRRMTYVRPSYCFNPNQININAAGGFIILGEQAKPAFPTFWKLMDDTNQIVAQCALIATYGAGSNAVPFMIKGMTNQFADVRNEAANCLFGELGDKYPEQRKAAIPLLVKLLKDPDDDVRGNATNQLRGIDPLAAARAGIK